MARLWTLLVSAGLFLAPAVAAAQEIGSCAALSPQAPVDAQTTALTQRIDNQGPLTPDARTALSFEVEQQRQRLSNSIGQGRGEPGLGAIRRAAASLIALDATLSRAQQWPEARLLRARLRNTLTIAYGEARCYAAAARFLRDALPFVPDPSPDRASVLTNLGSALFGTREIANFEEARRVLTEAATLLGTDRSYAAVKTLLGVYSTLGLLARNSQDYAKAIEHYLAGIELLEQPGTTALFQQMQDDTGPGILATLHCNLAISYGWAQRPDLAAPSFRRSQELFGQREPAECALARADHLRDRAEDQSACQALSLIVQRAPGARSRALAIIKRTQIEKCEGDRLSALGRARALLANEGQANPIDLALLAEAEGNALLDAGRASDAIAAYEEALSRTRAAAPAATLQIAMALANLSMTRASHGGDLSRAVDEARGAAAALRDWQAATSIGCSAGTASNKDIVGLIREYVSLVLFEWKRAAQRRGDQDELSRIDRDMFSLLQLKELNRVGVAAVRSALRTRGEQTNNRAFETALAEVCQLEANLARAVREIRPDVSDIAGKLDAARAKLLRAQADLPDAERALLASGSGQLSLSELSRYLLDGEGVALLRIGVFSSSLFVGVKNGAQVRYAILQSTKAKAESIARAMSALKAARTQPDAFEVSLREMSALFELDKIRVVFEGARHFLVVQDGALADLPAHLLPVGSQRLGELAPVSVLPSLYALTTLRDGRSRSGRSRSVVAIGDPDLEHEVECRPERASSMLPPDAVHRAVRCLGEPAGMQPLIQRVHRRLGGPTPLLRSDAKKGNLTSYTFDGAGIVLFGTHGLVGNEAISTEPALVLSPNLNDPRDNGLLTATEIARLNMDDTWLAIIAACNSGSASPLAVEEGFSGLGIAFITAGAKALLISHWRTDPVAAYRLITDMIDQMDADPSLAVASALSAAQQNLRKINAAPEFWGPFVLLGDGTTTMPR
jgi:CHAT domain-containing protein